MDEADVATKSEFAYRTLRQDIWRPGCAPARR